MTTQPKTPTDGFIFSASRKTASDASSLLGKVGGNHIMASRSGATLKDVLNCFVSLQFIAQDTSYISKEGGDLSLSVTTWDKNKMATFFDDMAAGAVKGINPAEEERLAALKIVEELRHDNNGFGFTTTTAR